MVRSRKSQQPTHPIDVIIVSIHYTRMRIGAGHPPDSWRVFTLTTEPHDRMALDLMRQARRDGLVHPVAITEDTESYASGWPLGTSLTPGEPWPRPENPSELVTDIIEGTLKDVEVLEVDSSAASQDEPVMSGELPVGYQGELQDEDEPGMEDVAMNDETDENVECDSDGDTAMEDVNNQAAEAPDFAEDAEDEIEHAGEGEVDADEVELDDPQDDEEDSSDSDEDAEQDIEQATEDHVDGDPSEPDDSDDDPEHSSDGEEDYDIWTEGDVEHRPDELNPNVERVTGPRRQAYLDRLRDCWLRENRGSAQEPVFDFPDGYELYAILRTTGQLANRHKDLCLYGHPRHHRFRSTPEFLPHFVWLLGGKKGACRCRYCKKDYKPPGQNPECICDWCAGRGEYAE